MYAALIQDIFFFGRLFVLNIGGDHFAHLSEKGIKKLEKSIQQMFSSQTFGKNKWCYYIKKILSAQKKPIF